MNLIQMTYLNLKIFLIILLKKKNFETFHFDSGLRIYQTHHCWATPHRVDMLIIKLLLKRKMVITLLVKYK